MLIPAYTKNEELNSKMAKTVMDSHYKFYHLSYAEPVIEVDNTFWNKVQLVSVNDRNKVCGYFKAIYSRPENCINSLSIINFNKEDPGLFALDTVSFFKYLILNLKVKKIYFRAAVNNSATKHYDKIVAKLGGRVVGIEKYAYLINDRYYDSKIYEIINDYWECDNCRNIIKLGRKGVCRKCETGKMIYKHPFKE